MDSGGDFGASFDMCEANEMRAEVARLRKLMGVGIANVQEAWIAFRMLREVLEQACPPGTIPNAECLGPSFTEEAEALLKGILVLISENNS